MKLGKTRVMVLLCSAALVGVAGSASARPLHQHHHKTRHHYQHVRHGVQAEFVAPQAQGTDAGGHYAFLRNDWMRRQGNEPAERPTRSDKHRRGVAMSREGEASYASAGGFSGFGGSSLVADARRYLGTNPTGRRSLWCGAFLDKVLRETGHRGGGNLALAYAHYGTRVAGPQVGAIAVMGRRGGGHVGIVTGVDGNGNPIIVSGNHNHTVAESVYPRGRILAYVQPNG